MNTNLATLAVETNEFDWRVSQLSENGQKVYRAIMQALTHRNVKSIWMADREISRRSRVFIQNISAAQSELQRAGLLHLEPGLKHVRYEFLGLDEAAQ
jgi:hypothetical protein